MVRASDSGRFGIDSPELAWRIPAVAPLLFEGEQKPTPGVVLKLLDALSVSRDSGR